MVGWRSLNKKFVSLSVHRGTFRMERQDGLTFDIRVPPFSLDSREDETRTL